MTLVHTLVGTALVAGGAAALNQVWERESDKLMRRTRLRPLPDARMDPAHARLFGVDAQRAGLVELAVFVNLLSAGVALATLVSYVWFYTPLKFVTSLSTIVGALPGALPAVIGWSAATELSSRGRAGCCSASCSCGRCRTSWRSRECTGTNTRAPASRCCR